MDRRPLLSAYVEEALARAIVERLEDGDLGATIPGLVGPWACAASVEECLVELRSVLEDWILVSRRLGHPIPVLAGLDLNVGPVPPEAAERRQRVARGASPGSKGQASAGAPEGATPR